MFALEESRALVIDRQRTALARDFARMRQQWFSNRANQEQLVFLSSKSAVSNGRPLGFAEKRQRGKNGNGDRPP